MRDMYIISYCGNVKDEVRLGGERCAHACVCGGAKLHKHSGFVSMPKHITNN